jgi:hypothetical protein
MTGRLLIPVAKINFIEKEERLVEGGAQPFETPTESVNEFAPLVQFRIQRRVPGGVEELEWTCRASRPRSRGRQRK